MVWPVSFSETSSTSSFSNGELARRAGRGVPLGRGVALGRAVAPGRGVALAAGRGMNGCTRYVFVASLHSVSVFARRSITTVAVIGGIGSAALLTDSRSMRVSCSRCSTPSCAAPSYAVPCAVTVTFACARAVKPDGVGTAVGAGDGRAVCAPAEPPRATAAASAQAEIAHAARRRDILTGVTLAAAELPPWESGARRCAQPGVRWTTRIAASSSNVRPTALSSAAAAFGSSARSSRPAASRKVAIPRSRSFEPSTTPSV